MIAPKLTIGLRIDGISIIELQTYFMISIAYQSAEDSKTEINEGKGRTEDTAAKDLTAKF